MVLLMFLVIGYEVLGIWFHCVFHMIPYVTRHTGVGALVVHSTVDEGISGWF